MRKSCLALLIAASAALGAIAAPRVSSAQVEVTLGVKVPLPPLPRFVFPAPPIVVVVPGTYVYVVPDVDVDIVFYHGYWYRPHGDRWYRAARYNGPWWLLTEQQVPGAFKKLPPGFRSVKPELERIPYQKARKNWKQWEKERHWDSSQYRRDDDGRHEEHRGHGGDEQQGGHGKGHNK